MKGRVMFGGAILCIFVLLDFGTSHHLRRATEANDNEVETFLVSENVNLNSDEVITETEIRTEVGEVRGHKYIKKTKIISTIVYFGGNLDERFIGETEESYVLRVFTQTSDEDEETFISRVFNKYDDETVAGYIRRVETFRRLNPNFIAFESIEYLELTKTYYTLTLVKFDFETVEEYCDRILRKRSYETIEIYTKRIAITRTLLPDLLVWKGFAIDFTCERGYISPYTSTVIITKRNILPVRLPEETEELYCTRKFTQTISETIENYFTRVFDFYEDETVMQYILRVETIRQLYSDLRIWNDVTYLRVTRPYFQIEYTRLDIETVQEYYQRVLNIQNGECFEEYEKRITILYEVHPELDVWKSFVFEVTSPTGYIITTTSPPSFPRTKNIINLPVVPDTNEHIKKRSLDENVVVLTKEETIRITYQQLTSETDDEYFRRITQVNVDEDDASYMDRVTIILKYYPHLTLWYDVKYLKYTEQFYSMYYSQEVDELDTVYYSRVLKRETYETDEEYEFKIQIIRSLFPSLPVWYSCDYVEYTKSFYTLYYTQRTSETIEQYFERLFTQLPYEDDVLYYKRVIVLRNLFPALTAWYDVKYLTYSEKFYKLYYSQEVDEVTDVYYSRVLKREIFETDEEYEFKIQIIRSLFPSLPVWYSSDYVEYTKSFYTLYYTQRTYETIEQYFERLFTQLPYEDDVLYYKRVIVLRNLFPALTAWYDVKYLTYSERFYKLYCSKQVDESDTVYYSRVLKREIFETDEEYEFKIQIIRSLFPSLPVWYSSDYVEYTKSFYTLYYTQRTSETIEEYFERLFTQLPYEDDVLYYKRVIVLRNLFPTLTAWYDVKYLTYSERFYKLYYSQEVDEVTDVYYSRVLKREIFETDEEYEFKIQIIRSLFPSLPVWYSSDYVEYTKSFYTLYYTQRTSETIEEYLERLFTQLPYEDDVLYYKRVIVLRNLFPTLTAWYDVNYLTYSERFYKLYCRKQVDESDTVYYSRVLKREIFETDEEYEFKIQIIRSLFPSLPVWYSSDYVEYTKSFYTLYYTQRTSETIEEYFERLFTQLPYEDDVLYYKRVIVLRNLFPSLTAWYDVKYLTYSEKFYKLYYSQEVDEVTDVYYSRVLKREIFETDEEYELKIQIIRSLFPSLPVWYSSDYVEYTKSFYTLYYSQRTSETIEEYLERLFTQLPYEDDVLYYKRVIVLRNLFPTLTAWYDVKYLTYSERFYKLYYSQEVDEVTDVYYSRVLKREIFETDEEYEFKIQIIRSLFPSLPVWYSSDYVEYTKSFYTLYYTQRTSETIEEYLERLFTQLPYEDDVLYYKRVIVLRNLFPALTAWYDVKYLTYSEKFYKLYYSKQVDELDTVYYSRVLKREIFETDEEYEFKIQIVRSLFPSLPVWYSYDYVEYTKSFYTLYYTQRTYETIEQYCERLFTQLPYEDDVLYYKRVIVLRNLFPSLTAWYDVKYLTYSEKFYKLYYSQEVDEVTDVYYSRVLKREIFETDEEYEFKIQIIRSLFPSLPVWYSSDYVEYTKSFYTLYYTQRTYETIEQYFERLFTQLPYEDDVLYYKRVIVLRNLFPALTAWYDVKYLTYSERFYKLYYSQEVDEVTDVYYSRVLKREIFETDEEYEFKIQIIRSLFPSLPVWYSSDYFVYTKSFYTLYYTQRTYETNEQYFERLFTRLPYEDDVLYYKRIIVLRILYPTLPVWNDVTYLKYTEPFYKLYYSQQVDEVECDYLERLFNRSDNEDDKEYFSRIQFIETACPTLKVWFNRKYLTYTEDYYRIMFGKKSTESVRAWRSRLRGLSTVYTPKEYARCLKTIKALFPDFASKLSKTLAATVYRKKFDTAVKLAKGLRRKHDSSSSSSSISKQGVASSSSSSSDD